MPQDISLAVRPVLYQTDWENWPYSHGGTLFVINFHGRCYGLTCGHVIGDEGANPLFVAPSPSPAKGMRPAPVTRVARVEGNDTDVQDIAVLCFSEEIGPDFFGGTAFVLCPATFGTSETAHRLKIYGYLSEKSSVNCEAEIITGGYCNLQFRNVGATSSDPSLRKALATYASHDFKSLDGISGAPVYDETVGRLCGMAARADLSDRGEATLWYIDVIHVARLMQAVHADLPLI